MANFNQSTNPVYVQNTIKLTKSILSHVRVFAKDSKHTKQYRIDRIKNAFPQYIQAVVEQPNNELMVVSAGELKTRYYIKFPTTTPAI